MNFKVVFFLTAIILAVYAGEDCKTVVGTDVRNLIIQAEQLWQRLKSIIQNAWNNRTTILNELVVKMKTISKTIQSKTEKEIDIEQEKVLCQVDEVEKEGKYSGLNITQCVIGRRESIRTVVISMKKEITRCLTLSIQEIQTIATSSINRTESIFNSVVEMKKEIKNCGTGWESPFCLSQVIGKLTLKVTKLPLEICDKTRRTVKLIESMQSNLEVCTTGQSGKVFVNTGSIIAEMVECVEQVKCQ